jgi:hypothetical protein
VAGAGPLDYEGRTRYGPRLAPRRAAPLSSFTALADVLAEVAPESPPMKWRTTSGSLPSRPGFGAGRSAGRLSPGLSTGPQPRWTSGGRPHTSPEDIAFGQENRGVRFAPAALTLQIVLMEWEGQVARTVPWSLAMAVNGSRPEGSAASAGTSFVRGPGPTTQAGLSACNSCRSILQTWENSTNGPMRSGCLF